MKTLTKNTLFCSVEEAVDEFKAGRFVIVVDDADRENEGDLTIAASACTPDAMNFMAKHGRGMICIAMEGERLDELGIPLMTTGKHLAKPNRFHGNGRREGEHHHRYLSARSRQDRRGAARSKIQADGLGAPRPR